MAREHAEVHDLADVDSELPGRARVHHGLVRVVRARHPSVHDAEPILVEELAVGARDHEHLAGRMVRIGCSVGVRECDLREVHARHPLHVGQASDLGLQLRDGPAVGVEQRDRHVGGVRAGEELRVRRLGAPRARDRAQRDPAGQSDQNDDRDVPAEPPAERRAEPVPGDPPRPVSPRSAALDTHSDKTSDDATGSPVPSRVWSRPRHQPRWSAHKVRSY